MSPLISIERIHHTTLPLLPPAVCEIRSCPKLREVFCQRVKTSKKEGMHKLAQKAGAKCGKLDAASKEGWRGEVVGTWNTKWDKLSVFSWGVYVSSFTFNALRRIWKRKDLHFICLTPCSNHEFDPFWLLHLMSQYTMGTFVIFKLSPLLNDHLLLDNENQSRLKMGGVHLALMKWMFSDGA